MKLDKQKILRYMFNPILARNRQFIGRHEGETCYIFGNGASLKNMELSSFSDHPTIGLNLLCLHNDFRSLNVQYYATAEPFFSYPFIKNPYINKYQINILGNLFKKAFSAHSDVTLFTSISNILGARKENTFYLHHFGNKVPNREYMNICGEFSFMNGALYAGVGLAINLGFKKAYLVGCDYLSTPLKGGHFYTYGPSRVSDKKSEDINPFDALLKEVEGIIELNVITDTGMSSWLPYQNYLQFKNKKIRYLENNEIVRPDYLDMLNNAFKHNQLTNKIYSML